MHRELWHLRNQPGQLVSALIFPVALVVLFGYVFGSAIAVPGGGDYRAYLMPGLSVMTSAFAVLINAMAISAEKSKGVMDRFRSMPMARLAVPFGQTGADIIIGTAATFVMAGCGLAVGWRPHDGAAPAVAAFALILMFRYAMSWAGVYLGLALTDDKTVDNLAPLIFPVHDDRQHLRPDRPHARLVARHRRLEPSQRRHHGLPPAIRQPHCRDRARSVATAASGRRHPDLVGALLAAFATLSVRRFVASSR